MFDRRNFLGAIAALFGSRFLPAAGNLQATEKFVDWDGQADIKADIKAAAALVVSYAGTTIEFSRLDSFCIATMPVYGLVDGESVVVGWSTQIQIGGRVDAPTLTATPPRPQ